MTAAEEGDRYLVVDGRRWRKADPSIPEALHSELVSELMAARRAVKSALEASDAAAERRARARVQDAKVALGERGQAWWEEPETEAFRVRIAAAIRALLRKRGVEKTICPSDAARICGGSAWRDSMALVREVAAQLSREGWLEVTRGGEPIDVGPTGEIKGPVRLRRRRSSD